MFVETVQEHEARLQTTRKEKDIRLEHWLSAAATRPTSEQGNAPPPVRTGDIGFTRRALERRVAHAHSIPTRLKFYCKSESDALHSHHDTGFDDPTGDYRWVRIGLRVKLVDNKFVPMPEEEAQAEWDAARGDQLYSEMVERRSIWRGLTLENIFHKWGRPHPVTCILYKRVAGDTDSKGRQHPGFWMDGGCLLTDLHFEAEQVEVGKPDVSVQVISNGQIMDTFVTTDTPYTDGRGDIREAKVNTREEGSQWGGEVYFREPTEAQFQAMLPTLELDLGDGGPPTPSVIFTLNREQTLAAANHLKRCVSKDPDRAVLTGILLDPQPDGIRLVATDTYRLMFRTIEGYQRLNKTDGKDVVVPPDVLLLLGVFSGEEVTLEIGEQPALPAKYKLVYRLSDGQHTVTGHLPYGFGHFPNYEKVVPSTEDGWLLDTPATLGTKRDFTTALKSLGKVPKADSYKLFVEQKGVGVVLRRQTEQGGSVPATDVNGNPVTLSTPGNGVWAESSPVPNSSTPCTLVFNANYFRDYLDTLKPDELVVVDLRGTGYPDISAPILYAHNGAYTYVLIPMKATG